MIYVGVGLQFINCLRYSLSGDSIFTKYQLFTTVRAYKNLPPRSHYYVFIHRPSPVPTGKKPDLVQTSVWLPRDLHNATRSQAIAGRTTMRKLIESGLYLILERMAYGPEERGL